jgi:hypothetical protein
VDGKEIFHSMTIARFVARKFGLIPKDDFDAAICDEVVNTFADIVDRIKNTYTYACLQKYAFM